MLLDFVYGFEIPLLEGPLGEDPVRNLMEALSLAHYLMYTPMLAPVATQIAKNISPGTALEVLQTAVALLPDTSHLNTAARSYILRHLHHLRMADGAPSCRDLAVYILTS